MTLHRGLLDLCGIFTDNFTEIFPISLVPLLDNNKKEIFH